jgi:ubiquinol-cytochrome c reductase iron-sulfur subunit
VSCEQFTPPLCDAARAGLPTAGKGANRTIPDCAARSSQGFVWRARSPLSGPLAGCWSLFGAPPAGRQGERALAVTTTTAAEPTRRDFLYIATGTVGAVGAAAVAWPLISQMNPDASTIAAGAPIEVDLAPITEGQVIKVFWRSKPIFIGHRSKKEIEEAQKVEVRSLPDPQPDSARVKAGKEQWLVLIGICTHLGCIPLSHQGQYDGFFCPCHGSVYDTSGRIRQGPAPTNLPVPPYEFVSDTKIRIG